MSWIPLVHRAITGLYLLSFLSSGRVDNLLFSVSGLLYFSASWYRALLFPYLPTHLVTMHVFKIWLRRTMNGFQLSGWPGCHLGEQGVILNTPGCCLSCKNISIWRIILLRGTDSFLFIITCFHIKFMPWSWVPLEWSFMRLFTFSLFLSKTFVKYNSSRFFYRHTRRFSSPSGAHTWSSAITLSRVEIFE